MFQLHSKVIEAKGLPTFDATNIFATLFINENEQKKTKQNPSNNPNWNQEFDFNFTNINSAMLKVEVFNNNGLNNEKIGEVIIPLNTIQNLSQDIDQWYDIKDEQGNEKGSVHLILQVTEENNDDYNFQQLITPTKYLVSFTVISAEDIDKLTESKNFDYTPDFYTVLQIQGKKRIEKTVCKIANFHPVWNQTFKYHIEAKNITVFNIKLKNHIIREDKDTIVAEENFDFCKIPDDTVDYDAWIELPSTTIKNEKCRLHVNIHFEETNDLSDDEEKDSELEIAFDKNNLFPEKVDLKVTILEARDLPDVDLLSGADPYCIAELGNNSYQTKTIEKSLSPNWNETFHFSIDNRSEAILVLTVVDANKVMSDKYMSKIEIPVSSFKDFSNIWYDLQPFKRVKKGGRIHILVTTTDPNKMANNAAISNNAVYGYVDNQKSANSTFLAGQTATNDLTSIKSKAIKVEGSEALESQVEKNDSLSSKGQLKPDGQMTTGNSTLLSGQVAATADSTANLEPFGSQKAATTTNSSSPESQATQDDQKSTENEEATNELSSQKGQTTTNDSASQENNTEQEGQISTESKAATNDSASQENIASQESQKAASGSLASTEEQIKAGGSASPESQANAGDSTSLEGQTASGSFTPENATTQIEQASTNSQLATEYSTSQKSQTTTTTFSSTTHYYQSTTSKSIKSESKTTQEYQKSQEIQAAEKEEDSTTTKNSSSLYDQNKAGQSIESESKTTQEDQKSQEIQAEDDSTSQKSSTIANNSSSLYGQNTAGKSLHSPESKTEQEDQKSQEIQAAEKEEDSTTTKNSSSLYDQNKAGQSIESESKTTQEDQKSQEIQEAEDDSTSQKSSTIANNSSSLYDQNKAGKSIHSPENKTTSEDQRSQEIQAVEEDSTSQRSHSIAHDSTSPYDDQNAAEVSTSPKGDKTSNRQMSPKNQAGGSSVSFRSEDRYSVGYSSSPRSQKSHRSRGPPTKDERFERTIESYIGFNLKREQGESCSSKCYSLFSRSQALESETIIEEEEEVPDQYDEQILTDQQSNDDQLRQLLLKEEEEFLSEIEERKNEIRQIVMADALKIYNENVLFPLQQTDMDLFDNDKNLDELKERNQNPEKMTQKKLDREILKLQEEIATIDDDIEQLKREIAELE